MATKEKHSGPIGSGGNYSLSDHGTNTQAQKKCRAPSCVRVWYFFLLVFVFVYLNIYIFFLESQVRERKRFVEPHGLTPVATPLFFQATSAAAVLNYDKTL
jgi:hypothetical protein